MKKYFIVLVALVSLLVWVTTGESQSDLSIRRGGGVQVAAGTGVTTSTNGGVVTVNATGGGSGLTNTFDANQFTLIQGTNVHFKSGAIATNLDVRVQLFVPTGSSPAPTLQTEDAETGLNYDGIRWFFTWADFPVQYISADGVSFGGGFTNLGDAYIRDTTHINSGIVTNNLVAIASGANPTNVVNLNTAVATNILDSSLTILHATNGATGFEKTHVRWFWAGGADRTLIIPVEWKTNVYSAIPTAITNGTITRMFVTSIGATGDSASQSNVFVSFEFYK